MARDYLDMALKLLPRGRFWRPTGEHLRKLLQGMTDEFGRIEDAGIALLDEFLPWRATPAPGGLLDQWERFFGLDDVAATCVPPSTTPERQGLVASRLRDDRGHSKADYTQLAQDLGYNDIVIQIGRPDGVASGAWYTDVEWRFIWRFITAMNADLLRCEVERRFHQVRLPLFVEATPGQELLIWNSEAEGQRWNEGKWGNALAAGVLIYTEGLSGDAEMTGGADGELSDPFVGDALMTGDAEGELTSDAPEPLAVLDWAPPEFDPAVLGAGADAYYLFDEASGDVLDQVGSQDLAVSGDVFRQSPAPGLLYDDGGGASFTGKTGLELMLNGGQAQAPNTTLGDFDGTEAVAYRLIFRSPGTVAGVSGLFAKRATVNASDPGLWVDVGHGSSQRNLGFNLSDGSNSVGTQMETYAKLGHYVVLDIILDPDANGGDGELRVRATGAAGYSASMAAMTMANCTSPTEAIEIGKSSSYGGSEDHTHVVFFAVFSGSAAANLDATALPNFHGDPQAGTAYEDDTISYSGVVPVPAGDGLWYLASGNAGQFPIGWSQNLIDRGAPNGFGRLCLGSVTNLCKDSWKLENWTEDGASASADAADLKGNKLGFRALRKVTGSSGNNRLVSPAYTVTDAVHQVWGWVYAESATDAAVQLLDASSSDALIDEATATLSAGFNLLSFAADTNTTSVKLAVEDTDQAGIWAGHFGLVESSESWIREVGLVIPTDGASATTGSPEGYAQDATSEWPEAEGQILMHVDPLDVFLSDVAILDIRGTVNRNRMFIRMGPSVGSPEIRLRRHYDGSAGVIIADDDVAVESDGGYRILYSWDSQNEIAPGVYSRMYVKDRSGTDSVTAGTASWSVGSPTVEDYGFGEGLTSDPFHGLFGYCVIYDEPSAVTIDEVL